MSLFSLVLYPDPRLKTRSLPVEAVTPEIRQLAADMFETMYAARGIGLAAVQIGVMKRLLVADVTWRDGLLPDDAPQIGEQHVLVNPEILESDAQNNVHKEGCLSFPDQFAEVERPRGVRVKYQDLTGALREETFDGLLATCIQHEIDHINGIVFPDRVSPMKRDMLLRKAKKIKKEIEEHAHHEHVHGEHCNH